MRWLNQEVDTEAILACRLASRQRRYSNFQVFSARAPRARTAQAETGLQDRHVAVVGAVVEVGEARVEQNADVAVSSTN